MGLEFVEFLIDVERAFGLSIPDHDPEGWSTPRDLVAYICRRIPEVDPGFTSNSGRWTQVEIEQVIEGLLAKHTRRHEFSLDGDIREIFS